MRSVIRVCAVAGALLLSALAAHALEPGAAAPELKLPGTGTATVVLAAMSGKVVYVDFWASWCAPCRLSFPWMNDVLARHQAQGLQVVAVNVDARRPDADRFRAETPARFTIAFDPKGETPRHCTDAWTNARTTLGL